MQELVSAFKAAVETRNKIPASATRLAFASRSQTGTPSLECMGTNSVAKTRPRSRPKAQIRCAAVCCTALTTKKKVTLPGQPVLLSKVAQTYSELCLSDRAIHVIVTMTTVAMVSTTVRFSALSLWSGRCACTHNQHCASTSPPSEQRGYKTRK